ncbi:Amylo-alpha-1,6-glucosidase [uncultured archaeon]|nr:Amylo-alpha-1,6-glucosidase [uncultured archaeon]
MDKRGTIDMIRQMSFGQGAGSEWLVTNGLGGYSSSTANGCNTRAYHGLLVAAHKPPTGRMLLLSSLDEELCGVSLATHQYPGAIHPQGFRYLQEFWHDPLPRFIYQIGDARIEKTVFMVHEENTTIISYKVQNATGELRVVPLVHCRSFHAASDLPAIHQEPGQTGTRLMSGIEFSLLSSGCRYVPGELTYYSFEYEEERRRGLSWKENLFSPGHFEIDLPGGDFSFAFAASTVRRMMPDWDTAQADEMARLCELKAPLPQLARSADSFVVQRGKGLSLIAGYHWFDDWGRDAMIALPGLLLSTGRLSDARAVLRSFAEAMHCGVLPNDLGAESYNTVDASLWFILAASSYYQYSHDANFARELWPKMQAVMERYSRPGEDFWMDEDGLIKSGPALTWMDARVDGKPVSGREGKCCEINALWYLCLVKTRALAASLGEKWKMISPENVKQSYQKFWNSKAGCLFDVIDPIDPSIRPNQIIAAAVLGLLPISQQRGILETVTRDLLTPFGLRTLSPHDARYIGRYEGGPRHRDAAYHQGTVWPWLMGPYVDALLNVHGNTPESKEEARALLMPLVEGDGSGSGLISEVFDGDMPQRPGGCIHQAWSVGEVLRAWARTA